MKTIYNTISRIGFLAVVGFSGILTSCDNDFDFDEARRENPEFVYRENFEKHFGKIDPNQSWDFTNGGSISYTRALSDASITDGTSTITQCSAINSGNGSPTFINQIGVSAGYDGAGNRNPEIKLDPNKIGIKYVSNGPIEICPIWHSQIEKTYSLVVYGVDPFTFETKEFVFTFPEVLEKMGSKAQSSGCNEVGAGGNRTTWRVDFTPGTIFYFGLRWADKTTSQRYIDCPFPTSNQGGGKKYMDISPFYSAILFDDPTGDDDFNDLVLGFKRINENDPIPDVVTDDITRYIHSTKRYMVEDLGAVDDSDIDFNDVVIDLTNTEKIVVHTERVGGYNQTTTIGPDYFGTTAIVRALGGTKNISVFLGNASNGNNVCIFTKDQYGDPNGNMPYTAPNYIDYNSSYDNPARLVISSGLTASVMYNTRNEQKQYKGKTDGKYDATPDGSIIATIDLSHSILPSYAWWDPDENNIFVKVYHTEKTPQSSGSQSAESTKTIEFPANGQIPYMIAVETDQAWNKERVSVFDLSDEGNKLQLTNHIPSSN